MNGLGESNMEWADPIKNCWEGSVSESFLDKIWEVSTVDLDGLEVQVVVDGKNNIHISKGTPSFVSFQINPIGMTLPIKCWIHTHPFGFAYWSGIDWKTINTWSKVMEKAIVLGNNQKGIWVQGEGNSWVWEDNISGEQIRYGEEE